MDEHILNIKLNFSSNLGTGTILSHVKYDLMIKGQGLTLGLWDDHNLLDFF